LLQKSVRVIKGGTLIDGTGQAPIDHAVILVEGNRIKKVGKELPFPGDADVVEAEGKTIMPGLIDVHVHLGGLFIEPPAEEQNVVLASLKATSPLRILYGAKHAKDALESGFTTLRNLDNVEFVALRKGIERDLVPGPRLLVSGWVNMTGGHLDLAMAPSTWPRRPDDTADGVWEVRKLVRRLLCREGADLIKTCASGGEAGEGEEPRWRNYTLEELKAMVDEAHAVGRRVAAHCEGAVGIRNAAEAGIDSIEHCWMIDEMGTREFEMTVELMKKQNISVVPTLAVTHANMESKVEDGVPEHLIRKAKEDYPHMVESFKKIHRAGVRIALGTDTIGHMPWLKHGDNAIELEHMVNYGMSEMDAILSATKNASECLGLQDRIGTIEEGKLADIIVVDGNPLRRVSLLRERKNIHLVMKEGRVFVRRG